MLESTWATSCKFAVGGTNSMGTQWLEEWYQNDGYLDATSGWQGPTRLAADWGNFRAGLFTYVGYTEADRDQLTG
jgi:hypothetical protein